jgi:RimJ/RimL family protein N-acetyltransferase
MAAANALTGERITLSSIRDADIDTIISWESDHEFMRMMRSDPAYPRPEMTQRAWWSERLKRQDE